MLDELQPLNKEIHELLKKALEQHQRLCSSAFSDFTEEDMRVTYILLDNPLGMPYYILFMIAHELGVRRQIYGVLKKYGLSF